MKSRWLVRKPPFPLGTGSTNDLPCFLRLPPESWLGCSYFETGRVHLKEQCCCFVPPNVIEKTHEFPADFPFNILSIFLPYGCQCSSVRVCGLSRPSVRAIFPAGDDGAVGVPFAKSCFSRLFVTGRRVWSPCTPLLSRTCPRSFVGLVVLRRCCRLSGRPLYSWGLAAHTSWLFFQHTDACVMCDV